MNKARFAMRLRGFGATIVCGMLAWTGNARAQLVEHHFDADGQGWTVVTIAGNFCLTPPASPPAAPPASIVFEPDTGWPGGCLRHDPPSENRNSFWKAPADFLGDKSAAYGGVLSFDMKQNPAAGASPWLILEGGGITLFQPSLTDAVSELPNNTWKRFRAVLGPDAGWRVGTCDGAFATATQIQQVLSNVTRLLIRAEYVSGAEINRLDNVVLSAFGTASSTFDADAEDWWFVRDAEYPSWDATGGVPDGCLLEVDAVEGLGYRILAPAKFLGNRTDTLGTTLEFDLKASPGLSDPQTFLDGLGFVTLGGGGIRLVFEQKTLPIAGNVWRHHAIPLVPCPAWTRAPDNEPATQADFDAVMAALSSFTIRGEFRNGGESERLDNVILGTCSPSAAAFAPAELLCSGDDATLSLAVAGSGPFTYQWQFNASPINPADNPSAVTPTLSLSGVSPLSAGSYDCMVTGACGSVTSSPVTLSVWETGSGDGDGNGVTDGADIQGFVNAMLNGSAPPERCAYDMDGNGAVEPADAELFIMILLAS